MRLLTVPPEIERLMLGGAALAISISGGKDSQAMLNALVAEHRGRAWPGPILAIHAHLGRAEWRQTLGHCRNLCGRLGIELVEVSRRQGDLVQEIRDRMEKLRGTGKPPWPDAQNRYCTSDQKRGPIDQVMRSPWPTSTQRYCTADQKRDQIIQEHRRHMRIVAAMGMRAQESPARSKRQAVSIAKRVTAKALVSLTISDAIFAAQDNQRLAVDWLPIHEWTEDDVWEACGHSTEDLRRRQALYREGRSDEALSGWLAHPAYVMGNQRLSCSICILASKSDIVNGARHNPELYSEYVQIERESGFTFRQGFALDGLLEREEVAAEAAIVEPAAVQGVLPCWKVATDGH